MGITGLGYGQTLADKYTSTQVEAVLRGIGVQVVSETYSDFLCYCPFHGNTHTPSFSVGLTNGLYTCFNASCGLSGTLTELVRKLTNRTEMEAVRYVAKKGSESQQGDTEKTHVLLTASTEFEWVPYPQDALERLRAGFPGSRGEAYMRGRKFNDDTLRTFEIGYSPKKDMVTVPVHSPAGIPVGFVGRAVEGKDFRNSRALPRNRTFFNIHRAKRIGDICIVTEASFDAMRVHQAGYPNVIAILGGTMSPENFALLDRHFNTIILMTDFDELKFPPNCRKCPKLGFNECQGHNPGRDTGEKIVGALRSKNFLWASYDDRVVYPHGAKDAGDMTDDEISQCIKNAVPHLEYSTWNIY